MSNTMFPNDPPQMPPDFMDAVMADPGAFASAFGEGMEAF